MAVYANLILDQGSDFNSTIDVAGADGNSLDLSTYTLRGQIRKSYLSSTAVDFNTSRGANTGELQISLTSTQTGNMKAGRYVYDIEIESAGGTVTRVVEGQLEVTPRVTRT